MKNTIIGKHIIRYNPETLGLKQIIESFIDNKYPASISSHSPNEPLDLNLSNLKSIVLMYPVLLNDKRWEKLHLTASSLFLGSSLFNSQFDVKIKKQILPVSTLDQYILDSDLIGLTLFEDLFLPSKELVLNLKEQHRYSGLIAAGGPMITLNSLESAYHFPEINLFVRGEAELILPELLNAIHTNNIKKLMNFKGFLFHIPGLVIISDFNETNQPTDFTGFHFNLDFLDSQLTVNTDSNTQNSILSAGLEINLSRGCKRSCTFCSAVQGRQLRQLPVSYFDDLLNQFSNKLHIFNIHTPQSRTININDDDILQDPFYAREIFETIKKNKFRLWGIQTSINSFFTSNGYIDDQLVELVNDSDLFVDNKPLIWVGTDTFLKVRGKRLGKFTPLKEHIQNLVEKFEENAILNYHYWISSDSFSDWEEFIHEFDFIFELSTQYNYFGLLPHAPFIVPYSTTPIYKQMTRLPELNIRIKYKKILTAKYDELKFPLVEKAETGYRNLNRLLSNDKSNNNLGFFDLLRKKDYCNAWITLYNFLKQERIESLPELSNKLILLERFVENKISNLI